MSTAALPPARLPAQISIWHRLRDYLLPLAAISVIFVMLVPLPAAGLDFLLALSMAASIIVFLSAVQIRRAVELSVFPTLLLLLTLFRLSLNIASSRRILLHGQEGTAAAGKVIEAFGQFVVGGNYVVGFVLFLALVAIQFLVVSHGAVRTAEVTARFTLDASAGQADGHRRRHERRADRRGRGAAAAPGHRPRGRVLRRHGRRGALQPARFAGHDSDHRHQHRRRPADRDPAAGHRAGRGGAHLHRADGGRRPGHDHSFAAGLGGRRHHADPRQLGRHAGRRDPAAAAGPARHALPGQRWSRRCMCLIPGMPKLAFLAVAAGLFVGGRRLAAAAPAASAPRVASGEKKKAEQAQGSDLAALLRLEDLTLEIGFQLIPLVDEKQGGQLLNRVRALRRHLSAEMGFLVPPVHISDNLRLKPREYLFSLRGIEIGRWQTEGPQLLAVSGEPGRRPLAGKETREPAFGVPAIWIAPALEEQAIAAGYSVVDAVTVITTHLGELIRQHAWELLGRAEIKRLLDALNESHPKLLEELVPKLLTLGEVARVLEQLLRERVSIRDLGAILEALLETAPVNKSLVALVEAARQALGRRLVRPLLDGEGQLPVLLLDPALEEEILATLAPETGAAAAAARGQRAPGDAAGAPPRRFCEIPYRLRILRGPARAPLSQSGPLSRQALAGAGACRGWRWWRPAKIPPEIRLRPVGTVR